MNKIKSELLLPVGNMEMALAAIHGGADAIYLGVPEFNARGRSLDFGFKELKEIIDLSHLYGVKVYLAFNVLIFERELLKVSELIEKILLLGSDAIIVQDLGLAWLIQKIAPAQIVHASTQMTITNFEAIKLLADLNIKRFVLGRENSIEEIAVIRRNTEKELEVFVHGALCVSYSGQCFTSESLGGRSANRGQCAQSCRFGYEMIVDGKMKNLGDRKYLVSPQDLCGIDLIPQLLKTGIDSFKVEGRLKTAEYVAVAAQSYRAAIEGQAPPDAKIKMAVTYSRGFSTGWLSGLDHQKPREPLVEGSYGSHRGYEFGKILGLGPNCIQIELEKDVELHPADGILWVYQHEGQTIEQGGFIYSIRRVKPKILEVSLDNSIKLLASCIGARVFFNHSKNQKKEVAFLVKDKTKKRRVPIAIDIHLQLNSPLLASFSDGLNRVNMTTVLPIVEAKTKGLTDIEIEEEFSSLSGSPFQIADLKIHRQTSLSLFIPHRELKVLRQKLTQELIDRRIHVQSPNMTETKYQPPPYREVADIQQTRLNILLRKKSQVETLVKAIQNGKIRPLEINAIILDFEYGRDHLSSTELLRNHNLQVGLATTRILKPNEYRNLKALLHLRPDLLLVRNLGALQYILENRQNDIQLFGDFSLNVTNHLTAQYLLNKGLKSLCISYDLNKSQVTDLLKAQPAQNFEITIHQHMPSFHMERCVFASFLSEGTNWRDCGKPCEKHKVQLRDQFGHLHEIKPDQECRNTMYNAQAQSAARFIKEWSLLGLGYFRYEALNEDGPDLICKIAAYQDYIFDRTELVELNSILGPLESYGLSEGQFNKNHEYQSRKKT